MDVRTAVAFSPGHITGFVEFPASLDDPILKGSRGAGFCIDRGVRTTIRAESSTKNDLAIFVNEKFADDAEVSSYVVKEYHKLAKKSLSIRVEHDLEIPVGYGLGSSGAAALSLSFALNKALDTGLSDTEAAEIAHKADLACKCGLGTVLAEYHGGFEMRLKEGAPGVGIVEKITAEDQKAVILCVAPMSTKDFLTNKISLVNGLGGKMLSKLTKTRSIDDFMEMSFQFAKSIGLVSDRSQKVIDEMIANGYRCSIALFGETVFSVVKNDYVKDAQRILGKYNGELLVCDIDLNGARMIRC